jgi:hypothetical protein
MARDPARGGSCERTRASPGYVHQHSRTSPGSRVGAWWLQGTAGAKDRHEDDAAAHCPQAPHRRAHSPADGRGRHDTGQRGTVRALASPSGLHHGGWQPVPARGAQRCFRRCPPWRATLNPSPQHACEEIDQQDQRYHHEDEELCTCHRCLYGLGPAGGSSPVSAIASRMAVSAWTFFIR